MFCPALVVRCCFNLLMFILRCHQNYKHCYTCRYYYYYYYRALKSREISRKDTFIIAHCSTSVASLVWIGMTADIKGPLAKAKQFSRVLNYIKGTNAYVMWFICLLLCLAQLTCHNITHSCSPEGATLTGLVQHLRYNQQTTPRPWHYYHRIKRRCSHAHYLLIYACACVLVVWAIAIKPECVCLWLSTDVAIVTRSSDSSPLLTDTAVCKRLAGRQRRGHLTAHGASSVRCNITMTSVWLSNRLSLKHSTRDSRVHSGS